MQRTGSVCSFLAIVVHLGASLEPDAALRLHLETFLPVILPWSMGQHFNARIYAQVALHLVDRWTSQHGLVSIAEKYAPLFQCIQHSVKLGWV